MCKTYDTMLKILGLKLCRKSLHDTSLYKSWQRQHKLRDQEMSEKRKSILQSDIDSMNDLLSDSLKFEKITIPILKYVLSVEDKLNVYLLKN